MSISATPSASPTTARAVDVRGLVIAAAQALAPQYPLHRFIARSPYAGYEDLAWDVARERIAAEHGVSLTRPESDYRARYAEGRINDADLVDALDALLHDVSLERIVTWGGRRIRISDIFIADMLVSPAAAQPLRSLLTPAERFAPRIQAKLDAYLARIAARTLGDAPAEDPVRAGRFWDAWLRTAARDLTLPTRIRRGIRTAPAAPEEAIAHALEHWEAVGDDAVALLRAHLLSLPGWAAAIADGSNGSITLTEWLAVRLTLEQLWMPPGTPAWNPRAVGRGAFPAQLHAERVRAVADALAVELSDVERGELSRILHALPETCRIEAWHAAAERHLALTLSPRSRPRGERTPPAAQVVMCIDPRSEGMRRHLEAAGRIETFGFAGFFALAIAFEDAAGGTPVASCPVLVAPRARVREFSSDQPAITRLRAGIEAEHAAHRTLDGIAESAASPFAYAEIAGWAAGPASAARTFAPRAAARAGQAWSRIIAPRPATRLDPDVAFALDERIAYAESALRMMGLIDRFARVVILCGHGATVSNNPFAAALQCGACGGHEGSPNARAAAAVFNDAETRRGLADRGIHIPPDTVFLAAQHDTVTDRITILEPWTVPATHADELARFEAAALAARIGNARERLAELPGACADLTDDAVLAEVDRRSADWAQAYPEWGLCGNVAMIVAPRRVTEGRDLARRVFLHSYEPDADPDGVALETILTAPMIVAQWINAQYAASTLAPNRFSAGSKTLHNVVGSVGVISGYGGDLRTGLAWQSVGVGHEARHDPVRLQVFVQAPLERVGEIVSRSQVVRRLVEGRWITLRAREHDDADWATLTRYGWRIQPLSDAPEPTETSAAGDPIAATDTDAKETPTWN